MEIYKEQITDINDGWISVDDKLPEEFFNVLGWDGKEIEMVYHNGCVIDGEGPDWRACREVYFEPTHWRPLPAPPGSKE